ncbi:MAG: ABC transporter ATP-binding protein [Candidatus Bathyarchaeota archaeon]|uniref:ABC transporter ATP-binding protein n=1 Tax=Candidatus Bathycorpusculum sp. TaxID=2994959 RepID=UPI00282DEBC3|nr:ABC transporter ATP-binding protein [Candidatus Termiticorpusculum sp.]MCL2257122.1 ABC transporter ATP-binding protein [Candidatus Termiticorpusculum sp.]MCL2292723.1 ABC transporter ATP-binding protein [Candidatus Termiticorpusculum sp.]
MVPLIEFKNIKKEYVIGDVKITALDNCSFSVDKGELVVILGPSGAGKTTILNLLGGMDGPSDGQIFVDNEKVHEFSKRQLVEYRRRDIGFVFQFYNLVGNLTALENVELACQICPNSFKPKAILEQVGLSDRIANFPSQLSGGEQQRVAIARAIAKNPKILLCDEPTGALDSDTGQRIISLLQKTCKEMNMTTVLITHNTVIADIADKVIKVRNGTVKSVLINEEPKKADEIAW